MNVSLIVFTNIFHVPGTKWFTWIQSSQLFELGTIIVFILQMKKIETQRNKVVCSMPHNS